MLALLERISGIAAQHLSGAGAPGRDPRQQRSILHARAEARAILLAACEIAEMSAAVDPLQDYAVESGLVARIGQDAVQQILSSAFGGSHDPLG
jgi:hypothetical protein